MKRILVTGAGGSPSTNFVRSLRKAPEQFYLIGVDSNKYYLHRAETEERYLIPRTDSKDYLDFLKGIIEETKPDLIYMQPDQEILLISGNRNKLPVRVFLPCHETIVLCQDKYKSYQKWERAGLKVPETVLVKDEKDLRYAFKNFGSPIWIRAIVSPGGGMGSFRAPDLEIANAWINYCKGWGNFVAAECLQEESVTWQSIWKDGKLVVAQGRRRLYWEFGNRAPSGVTGLTGTGVTISDRIVDEIAQKAIFAVDKKPHGIFSVDLTYDNEGIPNPTEINIGRFFTTHYFFTAAGLNMPYIFVKLAFGEDIPTVSNKINPLTPGCVWIRGMDFHPILTDLKHITFYEDDFKKRLTKLKNGK